MRIIFFRKTFLQFFQLFPGRIDICHTIWRQLDILHESSAQFHLFQHIGLDQGLTEGEFVALSGNQVGILLLDYILTRLSEDNAMPTNAAVVKSFVTTGMARALCDDYGVTLYETPVGFKFIGEKIKQWEKDGKHTYIFGFEESCGYLRGTHARDKDAVVASMLCEEMVCDYAYVGKSVFDRLQEIYAKYG